MLKGIIRCGDCGATLITIADKTGIRFQCCNYGRGMCKVSHSIGLEKANQQVIAALEDIAANDSYTFSPAIPSKQDLTRDWDKLIEAEKLKLNRAKKAYLNGAFDVGEYKAEKTAIEESIQKLREQQKRTGAGSERRVDIAAYHKKVMEVIELIKSSGVDELAKNEALHSILDKILFNKPQNTFTFYFA